MGDVIQLLNGYKGELQGFKQVAENVKIQRARNEATLEGLCNNEKAIVTKIQGLGYDPDNLDEAIADKTAELELVMDKLRRAMPDKDGNIPANAAEILGYVKPSVELVDGPTVTYSADDLFGSDETVPSPEHDIDLSSIDL